MARLEDGCRQVPGTAYHQNKVLFIVMLQGSAATALSPSDMSINVAFSKSVLVLIKNGYNFQDIHCQRCISTHTSVIIN